MRILLQNSCRYFIARLPLILFFLILFAFAHAQVITTVAGNGIPGYSGDGGSATSAQLNNPISFCLDASGNIYIAEFFNHRVRRVDKITGIITTIAGNGIAGFSGDGGLASAAQLNNPSDICVDASGNIYIGDNGNFRVRKINASNGIITTVIGNGGGGYTGAIVPGTSAGIHYPNGLNVDAAGNVYISLFVQSIICKLDVSTGMLFKIAGDGPGYLDGPAALARFSYPAGLSVSSIGNVYIADYGNNRIRMLNMSTGTVTTVAGTGVAGFSGDGSEATVAQLNLPTGIHVDSDGHMYIADKNNYRIRKVDATTGIISTIAGSGAYGFGGDGGSATSPCVRLADPHKVRTDAAGNVFFSDQSNARVRKVDKSPASAVTPSINIAASATTICANTVAVFTATISNAGTSTVYKWQKNGVDVGTNSATYSSASLADGDVIQCVLTTDICNNNVVAVSHSITMIVNPNVRPEVTIRASELAVCAGTSVTFSATNKSGNANPSYQWLVDGLNVGTNSTSFVSNTLTNGAKVECVMTVPECSGGTTKGYSGPITVTVNPRLNPSVNIAVANTTICNGSPVTFTATPLQGGSNPSYQWKLNGVNVGVNSSSYTTSALKDGDVVGCVLSIDPAAKCAAYNEAASNNITMKVTTSVAPSVTITASDNEICQGSRVDFTATSLNTGNSVVYQWQLNGKDVGNNTNVYASNSLKDGDRINCMLITNGSCGNAPAVSNTEQVSVKPVPVINFNPADIAIQTGMQTKINTAITGAVLSYEWMPASALEDPFVLAPMTKRLTESTTYQLNVISTNGCSASGQIAVSIIKKLHIPSSFTPNGDGLNDVFRIPPGTSIELKEFSIFDRWGNKIFTTCDIAKGWDGTYKGNKLSTNTFVYVVNARDSKGDIFLKGAVTLLR